MLPLSGTVAVLTGQQDFTWSGPPLNKLNAVEGAAIVIDGRTYFLAGVPSDTNSGRLTRPYVGANTPAAAADIQQLSPEQVATATLNKRSAEVLSQLNVLDANGRGLFYNLIEVTGNNDPGPGRMAFNNADPSAVTEIYLDILDANDGGRDVTPLIDLWPAGTILVIRSVASAAYAAYQLSGTAIAVAGYRRLQVSSVGGDGSLAAEPVAIEWRLAGADKDVDATVNTLADRAVFDGQPSGFRVFVNDIGDGRAARFVKASSLGGAWLQKGYFTGAPSTVAGPPGVVWRFAYDAATTYAVNDGVSLNGSSFRKRTAAPAGTAPSSASPPVHTADWEVLAAKGKDGTGTGDFVGPETAIADRLVAFDGATGKKGKDSGIAFDAVMLKSMPITNAQALPGGVIGSALSKFFSYYGSGNVIPVGGAAPTDTQGDAIIGISYTPRAAGNKIRCRAVIPCTRGNAGNILATITRSGSAAALALGISTVASAGEQKLIVLQDEFVTTSATAIMISLRVGPGDSGGVMYINGNQTQGFFGGVWGATLSVEEIKA